MEEEELGRDTPMSVSVVLCMVPSQINGTKWVALTNHEAT